MDSSTLISAEALAEQLDSPGLFIFDCRFDLARPDYGRSSFDDEHLPGAIHADLGRDLSAPRATGSGRHPLPDAETFASRLRDWGLNQDSGVVVYDDNNGMYAARLWWMLRWLGHDRVALLDGGLRRWRQLDLPLADSTTRRRRGNFMARPRPGMLADIEMVAAAALDEERRVIDVRGAERYRGEIEPLDPVAGHVPGARNYPFTQNVAEDARFLPAAVMRDALLQGLDGIAAEHAIAMCGSGVTACHFLLALEHAGLPGARLYAGSWSEWVTDPTRPVATGETP
jgi:thiosulfate/3-mercaptopyruvate sulfurtransferase